MIDLSIIGKEIERIYIANSDDKHILFYCADQSWYSLHYNHDHCQDPRYFLSSAGVVNLFEATVVSFVEDFAPTPLAGEIGSIGATITTNLGACIFSSVVSPYGCSRFAPDDVYRRSHGPEIGVS